MYQYCARVLRIVDGDTLHLDLDLGFHIRTEVTVRLARINAPDVVNMGATGIEDKAAAFIASHLAPGSVCVAGITRAEKYGRWLAELLYLPGETDPKKILESPHVLNDELVREGFALPYSGGRK